RFTSSLHSRLLHVRSPPSFPTRRSSDLCRPPDPALNVTRITPFVRPRHSTKSRKRADDRQRRAPKQQSARFMCAPPATLYFREPSPAYFCTPKNEARPEDPDPRQ